MFYQAKARINNFRRSPLSLMGATALLWGATEIARLLPMGAIFSPSVSWIDFFEMPVVKFYPVLALAAVDGARRIGVLAPLFFILTLGAISACHHAALRPSAPRIFNAFLIELQLAIFIFALYRLDIIASPSSVITALAFPFLYGVALTMKRRVKTNNSHPVVYGA